MGHEDAFPRPRLSARCWFSQGTFVGTWGNGRDPPIPDLPTLPPEREVRPFPDGRLGAHEIGTPATPGPPDLQKRCSADTRPIFGLQKRRNRLLDRASLVLCRSVRSKPSCEIAVITTDRLFRWVQHKPFDAAIRELEI